MSCSRCGEICRCSTEETSLACLRSAEPETLATLPSSQVPAETEVAIEREPEACADESDAQNDSAWRQELSARLNLYHSRRKPRPPRYPSLQLKFDQSAACTENDAKNDFARLASGSNHALAFHEIPLVAPTPTPEPPSSANILAYSAEANYHAPVQPIVIASPSAKIIEFPRSWAPPPPPLDQLAEPVITTPRILEAPEIVPPPPALGGITIEPPKALPTEKRPGIDIPLQSAALGRRLFAALIDSLIVAVASALFAYTFWKLTAIQPPGTQIVEFLAGLTTLFWSAYQYLLLVYAGTTPGLRLAKLQLCRFDGKPAKRSLRRWRVLASFLSAASLGMGYLWVFLDEDSLCWHDRITRTYLAGLSQASE